MWRNLTLFVALPVIVLAHINVFMPHADGHKEAVRPEFVPYEYLRIRTKVKITLEQIIGLKKKLFKKSTFFLKFGQQIKSKQFNRFVSQRKVNFGQFTFLFFQYLTLTDFNNDSHFDMNSPI